MKTDTELLDWLAEADGWALISDDAGRWACVCSGWQNVADPDEPTDIRSTFVVEAAEWKPSVRAAIAAAMDDEAVAIDQLNRDLSASNETEW